MYGCSRCRTLFRRKINVLETLPWLIPESLEFPPIQNALDEPCGLLAIGGDLSASRLISAYSKGIFPWFNDGEPPLWWSPCPRAIISTDNLYINKKLRKILNKDLFQVTVNHDFSSVIKQCADAPFRKEGTWINTDMIDAYIELHRLGYAHSIEVWHEQQLVGGLYGVAINGFFSGESMFYLKSNASKIALVYLAKYLRKQGIEFFDCQLLNPFLESMGCYEISREKFVTIQQRALSMSLNSNLWSPCRL